MKCVFGFDFSVLEYQLLEDACSQFSERLLKEIQKHLQLEETVKLAFCIEQTNKINPSLSTTALELIKLQSKRLEQRQHCRKYLRIYIYVAEENLQASQERCFALLNKLGIKNIRPLTKDELELNQKEIWLR